MSQYDKHRVSRSGRTCTGLRDRDFARWDNLPYGVWTCADGREVMFSRFYDPLWERMPGGEPKPADPKEWVRFEKQAWFYDDGTRNKRAEAVKALATWGLAP
jgi:crotonobetainyl-CoA:carnitine CoA-transferase CaiB-like acyl-CoA transferase